MQALPPADQEARLVELRGLGVLDTEAEERYDDVVRLASRICDMPISLISLVDADRQWFKAKVGMADVQTTLDKAICGHAILSGDFLEIPDTTADSRTVANPLVTGDDHLRFYAGAVLRSSAGHALGTLCVLDRKPRALTDLQRETLRVLAGQVVAQMELRRALHEAELLRQEVDHRVKNSLQSMAAMTRVQARMAKHPETRDALDVTRRRIDTIALLHQQLYASGSTGDIDLGAFMTKVVTMLQQSAPRGIRISAGVAPILLPSARAAAVGALMNEFAANALKHAFDEGGQGEIRFTLAEDGTGEAVLTCEDNGRGMPGGVPAQTGLGLKIIEASAQQLGGKADTVSGPLGTRTTIRIDLGDDA